MKRTTATLFIVGLLFEFAGFFGDQSENIPFVMRIVAPKYMEAQAGLNALSTNRILEPGQRGFAVLSDICLAQLRKENDPSYIAQISIQKLSRGNARLGFSTARAREVIPINVTLSNGQTPEWELTALKSEVDAMQNKSLFWLSLVVFLAGAVIQCFGFVVEFRDSKRKTI